MKTLNSVKVPDNIRPPISIADYTYTNHRLLSRIRITPKTLGKSELLPGTRNAGPAKGGVKKKH
jgi:hypothetical protein